MNKIKNIIYLKNEIFLGMFFAIITIFGESYKKIDSWNYVFKNIPKSIVLFLIYTIIFSLLIFFIEKKFNKIAINEKISKKITYLIFEKHPLLLPFIILLLLYLPHIIIKYPGTPGWDFYHFLNKYFEYDGILTHHFPLLYVFLCAYFIKFGLLFSSPNIGLFLLTCFHALVMITSFSMVFYYLKKWKTNYKFRWILLLFFAFNPLFYNYATTIYHDIIYSSLFLIYTLLLTDFIMYKENISKKKLILFSIMSLLVCLTRKNGVFIILPTNLMLLLKIKNIKLIKFFKFSLILPIILFYVIGELFTLKYLKTSYLEAMAIPIQTVSRYAKYYYYDISVEEIKNISKVVEYGFLPPLYNPTIVDPTRNNAGNYHANTEDIISFFKTWSILFFRHPDAYVEAFINNTYQLYYPFEKTTYIFFKVKDEEDYKTVLNFTEPKKLKPFKSRLIKANNTFEKIPLIKYVDDPGYYSWLFFILLLIIKKKKKSFIPIIPLVMTFLCCLAGPTIDYNSRYAFPIIFSILPLYAFYSTYINNKKRI